jgi:mevalonate kinase
VTLTFPDIGLDHTWNIDSLPWKEFSTPSKKKYYYDLVTTLDSDLLNHIKPLVANISEHLDEKKRKIHQDSATAFLYLYLSLSSPKSAAGSIYTLRSTIPIGAGLGSSASIAVCLSAALLLQIRALAGPHGDQPAEESRLQLERVNRWAFVAECCIHGNPSGVDNTVATGGKAVLFQRPDYTQPPRVQPLLEFPELPLLLVNTRQSRSTAAEVAKVAALRKSHPRIAELVLDAMDGVTKSAYELLKGKAKDNEELGVAGLKHLGELITVNHGLLVSLGVSHPKLERIRALIDHTGLGWTKLTGAGGGGCAITILKPPELLGSPASNGSVQSLKRSSLKSSDSISRPSSSSAISLDSSAAQILAKLSAQLIGEGFEPFTTTLAGDGVGVLWPAVLHNSSGEEGGEDIDQDKFLRAEGNAGIEKLVGVSMHDHEEEVREGWKFWRPWEGKE